MSAPLTRAEHGAQREPHGEDDHNRRAARRLERVAGHEGGQAHDRADREIDIAGDDDDGLADREHHQDGGVQQQVLDALPVQEAWRLDGRRDDEQRQGERDAELAGDVQPPRRAGGPAGLGGRTGGHRRGTGVHCGHASPLPAVAALC
jgi:hypothetical protein